MEKIEIKDKNDKFLTEKLLNPLLNDFYQFTMVYAYWKLNRHKEQASFDLFYRKNPFNSNYVVFQGLDEVKFFLRNFKFTDEHIEFLKQKLPEDNDFYIYLKEMNMNDIKIEGLSQGQIALPNTPLINLSGDLAKIQLIETCLLNLINYPTLISTLANEIRIRFPSSDLIEIGTQFSQSEGAGMMGVKYSVGCGLINKTSNLKALSLFDLSNEKYFNQAFFIKEEEEIDNIHERINDEILVLKSLLNEKNINYDQIENILIKEKLDYNCQLEFFQIVNSILVSNGSYVFEAQFKKKSIVHNCVNQFITNIKRLGYDICLSYSELITNNNFSRFIQYFSSIANSF